MINGTGLKESSFHGPLPKDEISSKPSSFMAVEDDACYMYMLEAQAKNVRCGNLSLHTPACMVTKSPKININHLGKKRQKRKSKRKEMKKKRKEKKRKRKNGCINLGSHPYAEKMI